MKQLSYVAVGAALASFLFHVSGWLTIPFPEAMASTDKPACKWPASLDAVAAAPENHRILLENYRVRVLDVTVDPGERGNLHAHCLSSVMYLMYEGRYKDFGPNGELLEEVKETRPVDQFPMTLWLEPQGPHAVENLDSRPVRLIRVELKDQPAVGT